MSHFVRLAHANCRLGKVIISDATLICFSRAGQFEIFREAHHGLALHASSVLFFLKIAAQCRAQVESRHLAHFEKRKEEEIMTME